MSSHFEYRKKKESVLSVTRSDFHLCTVKAAAHGTIFIGLNETDGRKGQNRGLGGGGSS